MNARTRSTKDACEADATLFAEAEADHADHLYDTLDASGGEAALWVAWGASCATVTFLREAGGPRLISSYLRALGRLALAELDVTALHELRKDLP